MQFNRFHLRSMTAALIVIFAGCGTDETAEQQSEVGSFDRVHADASVAVPGYVHSSTCSKFQVGSVPRSTVEGHLNKRVGAQGVLASNAVTGAVRGILNGDAAADKRPPLTNSAAVHNARVLQYFTSCGLPQDQIGQAQVLTLMAADGPADAHADSRKPSFVAYTTVITRQIDGIPVPDSFAAARFNADDEPTMEWVYWPAIPKQAVAEAKAVQLALADPSRQPTLFAGVPAAATSRSEVTIRHSDFADESAYRAYGSLDVHVERSANSGFRGGTRNIDINGQEVIHPSRRSAEAAVMRDTAKTR